MPELDKINWNGHLELPCGALSQFSVWTRIIVVFAASCLVPELSQSQEASEPPSNPARIVQSFSAVGIRNYVRNAWGSVGVLVENPTNQPVEVLCVMYFDTDSRRQYARQVWLPPRSRRSTWIGALTPDDIPPSARSVGIKTILYDAASPGDRETVIRSNSGQVLGDALLSVVNERPTTGVISDEDDEESFAAVVAMRLDRGLTRNVPALEGEFLPPTVESLEGLDQLVLMSDRPAADAAGITAIRQWLQAGGRLWIMLDQVDSATVARLLGDAVQVCEVDRVDLMGCTIKRQYDGGFAPEELSLQFENPVEFVRVLASQAEILQTIDGWPASFELRLGKGLVLCTTLAGPGWIRPRTEQDLTSGNPEKTSAWVANGALGDIGFRFSGQRALPALEPQDFRSFLFEQVGYEIVSRESVMLVLGAFWICVLGFGIWLLRRNRLVHLGWFGPTVAVTATIVLVWLGNSSRKAAPDTVALAQFVEAAEGSNQIAISGAMSLYQQAESSAPLGAARGGVFVPELADQSGDLCRMVRTDIDQWHLEEFSLPAGMLFAPFSQTGLIDEPLSARATFGPNGIVGTVSPGPFQHVSDLVIATSGHGGLSVRLQPGGQFAAGTNDVLRPGEFIGGSILSDEQRRRQTVYRKLLVRQEGEQYPRRPTLLAWAEPYDVNFILPPDAERKGSALLAVPLEFERAPAGTRLTIPAPLLPYEPVGAAGAYDVTRHEWIKSNLARQTMLRFQIPRGVLPIQLDRAVLTVSINAPSRTVDVIARRGTEIVPLETFDSPIGILRVETDQAELLTPDTTGGLLFGIGVSESHGEQKDPARGAVEAFDWVVQSLQLELMGEALNP